MKRYDLIVIGAGPAGLSAAIEAAEHGMAVVVFDENDRPGGQLFKQIHKFFGSKEHHAKERGFRIGEELLQNASALGVEVRLNATVMGIFNQKEITVMEKDVIRHYCANGIIIATGASENTLAFPGWTLPGVMGAGAAQTMMNIHGVQPGKQILMVGSGNVGVVVGYQLIQAGCRLMAVIDAASRITGYGVHAAKIARMAVPFYLSYTILEARGTDRVQEAVIAKVDSEWKPIPGTETVIEVDTICLAVGLTPMSQLARMAGCKMEEDPVKGGYVPICGPTRETSIPGIYVAGDVAGIEEASSAMIQGKLAGIAAAYNQGYLSPVVYEGRRASLELSLSQLHMGMFGPGKKGKLDIVQTDEGCPLCESLMTKGYLSDVDIFHYPGIPTDSRRKKGLTPVIECTQNIPCDPCQDACPKGCIKIAGSISGLPEFIESEDCTGCGMCVAACPGQAIFLVDEGAEPGWASITLPYELSLVPQPGDCGVALDRAGNAVCEATVVSVRKNMATDETVLLTMRVPSIWAMTARFYKAVSNLEQEVYDDD